MKKFILLIALSCALQCYSQLSNLEKDSLFQVWQNTQAPDSNRLEAFHRYIEKGFLYQNPDSCFVLSGRLEMFADSVRNFEFKGKAALSKGVSHAIRGNYDLCQIEFERSLHIFDSIKYYEGAQRSSFNLSNLELMQGDTAACLAYLSKSESLSTLAKDTSGLANVLYKKASISADAGNLDSALLYIQKSKTFHKKAKSFRNMVNAFSLEGDIHRSKGDFLKASQLYVEGVKLAETHQMPEEASGLLAQLSYLSLLVGEYEKALLQSRKGANVADSIGDTYASYNSRITIISSLLLLEKYDDLPTELEKNYSLAKSMNDDGLKIKALLQFAEYHDKLGQYDSVKVYVSRSYDVLDNAGIKDTFYALHRFNAVALLNERDFNAAESEARKAIKINRQAANMVQEKIDVDLLIDILSQKGGYKEATELALISRELGEQINSDASKKEVLKNNFKLDYIAQSIQDSLSYDFKEQLLKSENTRQKQISFISILGLAIFLVLSIFLFKSRHTISRQKEVILESLTEKDTLLREIHHRVKNNLQVVSSLLRLQTRSTDDETAREALNEGQTRVQSMSLIHKNLYSKENLTGISMKDYLKDLCTNLVNTYDVNTLKVSLKTEIEDLNIDVDTVVPLGLIINELITNSLKYAFPNDEGGEILVSLKEENDVLLMTVKDNGVGFNTSDISNHDGFGTKLIRTFKKKLNAEIEVSAEKGTSTTIRIKNYSLNKV